MWGRAVPIAAAFTALIVPAAHAGSASTINDSTGPAVSYIASGGERNDVTVRDDSTRRIATIHDAAGVKPRSVTSGCVSITATDVWCSFLLVPLYGLQYEIGYTEVSLDDGDDRAYVDNRRMGASIHGGPGDDLIIGGDGPQLVLPSAGHDTVILRGGDDRILETSSLQDSDYFSMGAGNDRVESTDGFADEILCGPGNDHVRADPIDVVAADCEVVVRVG